MAKNADKPKPAGMKPDVATILGIVCALGGIVGGLLLEKGQLIDVAQYTAALIVVGGTLGATLVGTPLPVFFAALGRLKAVFFQRAEDAGGVIEQLIGYATKARKNGIVSLEADAEQIADPFLRKALTLAVDGTDLQDIRNMLELEIEVSEHRAETEAKVFESAGGFAPTIGIIGAVMGLIQVMKHLENIQEVGKGIAVAFVATIYGVGIANIFLLPAAAKIKTSIQHESLTKEMIVEGVAGIVEGLNPKVIRTKLEPYASNTAKKPAAQSAAAAKPAKAA